MHALAWGGIVLTFIAVLWGKLLVAAALELVKTQHPRAYETMSDYGTPGLKRFSPVDGRVRRALAVKMLTGNLPAELASDEQMATLAWQWRLCIAAMLGGFALVGLVLRASA